MMTIALFALKYVVALTHHLVVEVVVVEAVGHLVTKIVERLVVDGRVGSGRGPGFE